MCNGVCALPRTSSSSYDYDEGTPPPPPSPPAYPTSHWVGEVEGEGPLSDLDPEIEDYLASEKEVREYVRGREGESEKRMCEGEGR